MGNCCGKDDAAAFTGEVRKSQESCPFEFCHCIQCHDVIKRHLSEHCFVAFIQGHRLGEAREVTPLSDGPRRGDRDSSDETPAPRKDPTLTDEEREKQRKERIAAVEARLKKAGGPPKKKKEYKGVPLSGPNSKSMMTWTAG